MIRVDRYPTGRKHCSRCGRWRHIYDFGPDRGGYLKSRCRTCERVVGRVANARRQGREPYRALGDDGRPTHCKRGHSLEDAYVYPNGRYRECRVCRNTRRRSPVGREAHRIYQEATRRRRGIEPRRFRNREVPQGREERLMLPAAPFVAWLKPLIEERGLEDVLALTHLHPRRIYSLLNGEQNEVHIDIVDRALTEEGTTFLWTLYPALYDEAA